MNAMKRFALLGTALMSFLTGCGTQQEHTASSQPKASASSDTLESYGIPTEFHAYEGLPHGFGLGTGTVAEGWIYDAVNFWEEQFSQGELPKHRNVRILRDYLLGETVDVHGID